MAASAAVGALDVFSISGFDKKTFFFALPLSMASTAIRLRHNVPSGIDASCNGLSNAAAELAVPLDAAARGVARLFADGRRLLLRRRLLPHLRLTPHLRRIRGYRDGYGATLEQVNTSLKSTKPLKRALAVASAGESR
ncbi:MAG TPA: hypothetical protein VIV60_17585 [Polyangiaceae bacterium]